MADEETVEGDVMNQTGEWAGKFGDEYLRRNDMSLRKIDGLYKKLYGLSRSRLNKLILPVGGLPIHEALEVGCGSGNQMAMLRQSHRSTEARGIDVNGSSVKAAVSKGFNVKQGSVFDIPYDDDSFDLVYTSGLLIHIHPDKLKDAMSEIVRVSSRYVWGYEYFSIPLQEVKYRDHHNMLWKWDYADAYEKWFGLKLLREIHLVRLDGTGVDSMFLLEK
jgi:pseudaminic acid biosynthesis-associated methylase